MLFSCHDRFSSSVEFYPQSLSEALLFRVTPLEDVSEYNAYIENENCRLSVKLRRILTWTKDG